MPEIAERLHTVIYNEDLNQYHAAMINSGLSAKYVQGAWYAYQEHQKKIDMLKAKVQELWTELDDRQSKEHIIEKCESIIQELLKE